MKHIKTFEAYPDYIQFYSLKKYAICKDPQSDTYLVLELIKSTTENFNIEIQTITFSKKTKDIQKSAVMEVGLNTIKDRIIFQSDNIEEIREQLDILQTKDKFNL